MGREQSPTEKMSKETLKMTQQREHNSQEIVTRSSGPGQGSLVRRPHLPREQEENASQVLNLSERKAPVLPSALVAARRAGSLC